VMVHPILHHMRVSTWETDHLRSHIMVELLLRIVKATKSIRIMSPNFNEGAIWHAIRRAVASNPQVTVQIMTGYKFNNVGGWFKKTIFGYATNENFITETRRNHERIEWRWYGDGVNAIDGGNHEAVHAKMILIDDDWIMTGSFNCDVFSSLTSFENVVIVEDKRVSYRAQTDLFDVCWQRSIPV
jgi:phosphatidylserine/phosphatidylglycerophosphate/cardiolipin synthase-like enzyme